MSEENGGELKDLPNDKYKKFFDKFKEIDEIEIESYKPVHILAFFCKKYKEEYGIDYKFKFNSLSPSKCFEIFQIKKLAMNLTSDPILLVTYINWMFETKAKKSKRRLTSISFLTKEDDVNYYKLNILLSNKILNRTSLLPDKYKLILEKCGIYIKTYGEISLLSHLNDDNIKLIISQLEQNGFDKSILNKII